VLHIEEALWPLPWNARNRAVGSTPVPVQMTKRHFVSKKNETTFEATTNRWGDER
jgi:hypothetical protein